jgi:putative inorganic carbon (hco3(-)) transporter
MFGTGLGTYVPFIAYCGFWIAIFIALFRKPLYGLYYMIPFLPYRTMRDHFGDWPLGGNMLTILVIATFLGALLHGKKLPKGTKLPLVWLLFGVYMYFSMWMGTALTNAPAPIWLSDINFVTWKDYMLLPLIFVAATMVIDDRKAVRTVIMITAFSVLMIDRSSLMDSLSHSWSNFDENKRGGGPLGFGSNQTAAFLAQFGMYFWAFALYMKRKKLKLASYGLAAITLLACMYCFSRAGYLAIVACVIALGILKDRKLIIVAALFLVFWQAILPTAVTQRVTMTKSEDGQLEASAEERVKLWDDAENTFMRYPIFGTGFATFQFGEHVDNLKDTHNWYVKVLVETGIVGLGFALALLYGMFKIAIRLFRKARDPLYSGLGLGLLIALISCVITNFFGDRWTYIEITSLLWVLVGAALKADQLTVEAGPSPAEETAASKPYPYAYAH